MKRILLVVLVMLLVIGGAMAEGIDLSGMSFDELVALKEQINLAIWNSQEWQEVEVPKGVWTVGEDIPAGTWTIKAADGLTAYVNWGDKLNETGTDVTFGGSIYESDYLYSVNYRYYEKGNTTEVTWELQEGQYFVVSDGIALFTPYTGKPGLGFK